MADAMRQSRVVLGQTGLPTVQPEPEVTLPSAGVAALGGDPKSVVYEFPGAAAKHSDSRKSRRGARRVQHPHRARRHRPARADGRAGARQRPAVAVLRDAAGGDRLQHHSDPNGRGRHQGRRPARLRNADRPQRPALDPFCAARSGAVRVRPRSARRPRHRGPRVAQACPDRHIGGRPARFEDDAQRSGHAGRRNSRPGAGKHPVQLDAVAAELRRRRGTGRGVRDGRRDHRAGADPVAGFSAAVRRRLHRAARRNVLVLCSRNKSC